MFFKLGFPSIFKVTIFATKVLGSMTLDIVGLQTQFPIADVTTLATFVFNGFVKKLIIIFFFLLIIV